MNEQEELQRFMDAIPDVEQLRREYSALSDLLIGEFVGPPNIYELEPGNVVSWNLAQGEKRRPEYAKDPTYGRVPKGHFEFGATHTEVFTLLRGSLDAEANGVRKTMKPLEKIVAPVGSTLKLDVRSEPVLYFCEYMKAR